MAERTLMDVAHGATVAYLRKHSAMWRWHDDMLSDACLGVTEAAATYRDDRGATLATFAGRRANGAILDGVRRRAPLTRGEHARGATLDTLPAHRQPAMSVEELTDGCYWEPAVPGMEDAVADADLVARMLATCTQRERIILSANLLHGYTLTAIAEHFGCTVSYISQQRTAVLARLRAQFAGAWQDAA